MKLYSCFALSSLVIASLANAQGTNEVLRNNNPYLVQSTGTHPTTARNYNWPPVNHPDYSSGVGVPQGTAMWRVFPAEAYVRQEQIRVTGFTRLVRSSAATVSANYYSPATQLYRTRNRTASENPSPTAFGPGQVPDFSAPVGTGLLEMPAPSLSATTVRATDTFAPFNARFSFNGQLNGFAFVMDYHGGEEQNLPADPVAGVASQGFVGSWQDGPFRSLDDATTGYVYVPEGWYDYASSTFTWKTISDFRTWCGILTDQPSIAAYSDWGQRDYAALATLLRGHSDGTCFANLASDNFYLGVSVAAGNFTGGTAVIHMNVQPMMFPTLIPVPLGSLGTLTYETAPFDGFFLLGLQLPISNAVEHIDLLGLGGGGPGTIPPFPTLLGQYIGFEATLVDAAIAVADTTEAEWIYVAL